MMFHRKKKRAVTAYDIWNLVFVQGVLEKPGFYKVQHRKSLAILTRVTLKHRCHWVWVSKSAFGVAPLVFGAVIQLLSQR